MTVKPPVGHHGEKEASSAASSISIRKAESLEHSRSYGEDSVRPRKEVEPSYSSSVTQSKPGLGAASTSGSSTIENGAQNASASVSAHVDGSASTSTSSVVEASNAVVMLDSIKDKCNEPGNTGCQDEVLVVVYWSSRQ